MARQTQKTANRPIIFDTDVLVWYFRGKKRAHELLRSTERDRRWITSLTLMELIQGCRTPSEITDIEAFVNENISRVLHPKTAISEKAIHLVSQYALSHGLRIIDALIASSAQLHGAVLATGNSRHFRFIAGLHLHAFSS